MGDARLGGTVAPMTAPREQRAPPDDTAGRLDGPADTSVGPPAGPTRDSTADPTSQIVELLHALGTQMHAVGARFAATEHLHHTDVQALSILALAGGRLTAGELARALDLSSGATTRLVDRLERVGHVARHPDTQDRRRRHVDITPGALATAGAFFGQLSATMEDVLAPYGPEDQRVIRDFLQDVVAAMEDQHPA
jgi:DNA-binding MarR family transcriptional regulator